MSSANTLYSYNAEFLRGGKVRAKGRRGGTSGIEGVKGWAENLLRMCFSKRIRIIVICFQSIFSTAFLTRF